MIPLVVSNLRHQVNALATVLLLRGHEFEKTTNLEMWTFRCQFCFLFVFPSILCFKMPCRLISSRPSITISRCYWLTSSPPFTKEKLCQKGL